MWIQVRWPHCCQAGWRASRGGQLQTDQPGDFLPQPEMEMGWMNTTCMRSFHEKPALNELKVQLPLPALRQCLPREQLHSPRCFQHFASLNKLQREPHCQCSTGTFECFDYIWWCRALKIQTMKQLLRQDILIVQNLNHSFSPPGSDPWEAKSAPLPLSLSDPKLATLRWRRGGGAQKETMMAERTGVQRERNEEPLRAASSRTQMYNCLEIMLAATFFGLHWTFHPVPHHL